MIRVVFDTTVLVAAVISPAGPNAQVFELMIAGKIRPYATAAVIEEYYRVFEYNKHLQQLDKRRIARLRGALEVAAIKVKSRGRLRISPDESDNRIYECAVAAKADYIITENTKDFPKPHKYTKIITARQLLTLMEADQA